MVSILCGEKVHFYSPSPNFSPFYCICVIMWNSVPWACSYTVGVLPFFQPEVGGRGKGRCTSIVLSTCFPLGRWRQWKARLSVCGSVNVIMSQRVWGPGMHVPSSWALQHRPGQLRSMFIEESTVISSCSDMSPYPILGVVWSLGLQRKHGLSI